MNDLITFKAFWDRITEYYAYAAFLYYWFEF